MSRDLVSHFVFYLYTRPFYFLIYKTISNLLIYHLKFTYIQDHLKFTYIHDHFKFTYIHDHFKFTYIQDQFAPLGTSLASYLACCGYFRFRHSRTFYCLFTSGLFTSGLFTSGLDILEHSIVYPLDGVIHVK